MATALKPVNDKEKELSEYSYKVESDWDNEVSLFHKQTRLFHAEIGYMRCCAFKEINAFEFGGTPSYNDDLQKTFNAMVEAISGRGSGSVHLFVLNKGLKAKKPKQPDWFVKCLENYPGAYCLDWMPNRTHDPINTEVKMYLLPTV